MEEWKGPEHDKTGRWIKDKRKKYDPNKQIVLDKPKFPVIRSRILDDRHIDIDLRGIRNPLKPMNGRLNPTEGTPCRFLSAEHLQEMVGEYFESCYGPMFDKYGQLVRNNDGMIVKTQVKAFTMSGLALYLGVSTDTLKKYRMGLVDTILDEMRAETDDTLTFAKVIATAKQTVEAYAEGRLYDRDGQRGAQFVLDCVFGWVSHKDESDINRDKAATQLRQKEFEFKKKLIDEGDSDDAITINIVRGRRDDSDE